MTLPELADQVRLTRRVTVSPTAAAQFAALRHAQDHIRSGVLFGRWTASYGALSIEAATAGGGLEWQQSEQASLQPFTTQPSYIEGCHDTLCAPPDVQVRQVGSWAVLPPLRVLQPHRPVLNTILTQGYDRDFLKTAGDQGWLTGPQVVIVVREHTGRTDGHAYVFDPSKKHRLLKMGQGSSWPSGVPLPLPPAPLWLADDQGKFWPM